MWYYSVPSGVESLSAFPSRGVSAEKTCLVRVFLIVVEASSSGRCVGSREGSFFFILTPTTAWVIMNCPEMRADQTIAFFRCLIYKMRRETCQGKGDTEPGRVGMANIPKHGVKLQWWVRKKPYATYGLSVRRQAHEWFAFQNVIGCFYLYGMRNCVFFHKSNKLHCVVILVLVLHCISKLNMIWRQMLTLLLFSKSRVLFVTLVI